MQGAAVDVAVDVERLDGHRRGDLSRLLVERGISSQSTARFSTRPTTMSLYFGNVWYEVQV